MYSKYVKALGVELEGVWNEQAYTRAACAPSAGTRFVHDGSVRVRECTVDRHYVGEALPARPFNTAEELAQWLETAWPSAVPSTWVPEDNCGFHIHASVRNRLFYQQLMDPDFQDLVISRFTDWANDKAFGINHPIWARLRGESQYCRLRPWHAYDQARISYKDSVRYRVLNYCHKLHGTVELRVLPMFKTWTEGREAVAVWVQAIDDWLTAHKKPVVETLSLAPPTLTNKKYNRIIDMPGTGETRNREVEQYINPPQQWTCNEEVVLCV